MKTKTFSQKVPVISEDRMLSLRFSQLRLWPLDVHRDSDRSSGPREVRGKVHASLRGQYSILTQNNALPGDSSQNDHTIPFGLVSPILEIEWRPFFKLELLQTFAKPKQKLPSTLLKEVQLKLFNQTADLWNHGVLPIKTMIWVELPHWIWENLWWFLKLPNCNWPNKHENTQLCIHSNKTDMQHSWSLNFRGGATSLKRCNTRDLVTFLRGKERRNMTVEVGM